jgi:hypothetical protein
MRKLLLTAGVLAMSVATASVAKPGENRGGGARAEQSQGRGHGGQGGRAENRGRGNDGAQRGGERREMRVAQRENRRENRAEHRGNRGQQRAVRQEQRAQQRVQREDRREQRAERRDNRIERGDDRRDRRDVRVDRQNDRIDRAQRRAERRAVVLRDSNQIQRLRFDRGVGLIDGCPPGLARRNNGCMPPGQLRQQQRAWYSNWWGARDDAANLVYDDGYLYRLAPSGAVAGFAPLLGGALWPGQTWPAQYQSYDVPDYYADYYGFDDQADYRLADGVIYGLDPQSQAIQSVLALVTDNDWQIGQRMPDGYGVYNVPYDYRDQYADTADSLYRYDDGYVYQVDPTTQLIQAAIQLIT